MRFLTLLAVATCAVVPAVPAAAEPAQAPVTVARYSFDTGGAGGAIADQSGRGLPLRIRTADGGALRFITRGTGRAVAFPARCATTATTCPRVLLEGGDDVDLDPGTRSFRYGAFILATPAQIGTGANIMQKGVATTESQWKLQIGRKGKPNCVLVGRGAQTSYLAKADISVADGRWHQVTCRRLGTSLTILVDNVSRGTTTVPANVDVSNALPIRIGGRNMNSKADMFGGALDEVYAALG